MAVSFPQHGTWATKSASLAREAARPRLPSRGLVGRLPMSHSVQDACRRDRPRRIDRTCLDEEGCHDGCGRNTWPPPSAPRASAAATPLRVGLDLRRLEEPWVTNTVTSPIGLPAHPSRRPPTRREPQLPIHRRQPACDCSTLSSCSPKADPDARRHLTNSNSRPISGICPFIMTAGPIVMIGSVSAISWAGLDALVSPIPTPAYSS